MGVCLRLFDGRLLACLYFCELLKIRFEDFEAILQLLYDQLSLFLIFLIDFFDVFNITVHFTTYFFCFIFKIAYTFFDLISYIYIKIRFSLWVNFISIFSCLKYRQNIAFNLLLYPIISFSNLLHAAFMIKYIGRSSIDLFIFLIKFWQLNVILDLKLTRKLLYLSQLLLEKGILV